MRRLPPHYVMRYSRYSGARVTAFSLPPRLASRARTLAQRRALRCRDLAARCHPDSAFFFNNSS